MLIIAPVFLFFATGCTLNKPLWKPYDPNAPAPTLQSTKNSAVIRQNYSICPDCILLKNGESAIHSAPDNIKGYVESILIMGDKVQFQGWAANVENKGPIDKLLIFSNDRLVYEGSALLERLDIAKALGDAALLRSGYSIILDKSLFVDAEGKEASISIFALSKDLTASKLPFKAQ